MRIVIAILIISTNPFFLLAQKESASSLWNLFKMGGVWMWFLLILSILTLGFILEKLVAFYRFHINSKNFFIQFEKVLVNTGFYKIKEFLNSSQCLVSKVINCGFEKNNSLKKFEDIIERQTNIQVKNLSKGLTLLATIGSIAPLIGFLGTVAGMIRAFGNIAAADEVSAQLVAGGIYTALTTTAYGLIIAIPAIAMYNFFVNKIDNFVADIERATDLILNKKLIK